MAAGQIRINEVDTAIPEIWAAEALQQLKKYTVAASLITRDYENEIANYGDTVNITNIPALVATSLTDGNDVTLQQVSTSNTALILNKHYESSFSVTRLAEISAKPDVMAGLIKSAVISINEQVESDIMAEYANYGATVGSAGTDLTLATITNARKALVDAKVPKTAPKWLIISSKDAKALLDSNTLINASAIGSTAPLTQGSIGRLYGFDVYESQCVKTSGSSPLSTHNLAGVKESIAIAFRPMGIPNIGGVTGSEIASDGYSVRVLFSWNATKLATQVTIDVLYGIKTLRSGALLVRVLA